MQKSTKIYWYDYHIQKCPYIMQTSIITENFNNFKQAQILTAILKTV